ncbi:hypothetical protein P5G51_008120 [Virgibacillus sp. 179-BFC.A HS]|uniref:Uncharacterized protein n=1 Tax=Tigheibacillus jepli TaxID=3035914 RepID=A0ABU5CGB9_9BACI|nr:hypothetical protein [Virgibacillus sp. 179-BFC.A HS]MDY0405367.1 hypothetical protein [Virgibacillus sp. 179-BFC.A HS]
MEKIDGISKAEGTKAQAPLQAKSATSSACDYSPHQKALGLRLLVPSKHLGLRLLAPTKNFASCWALEPDVAVIANDIHSPILYFLYLEQSHFCFFCFQIK